MTTDASPPTTASIRYISIILFYTAFRSLHNSTLNRFLLSGRDACKSSEVVKGRTAPLSGGGDCLSTDRQQAAIVV